MRCAEARGLMLEADPAALAAVDESPLSEHIHACDECAALAGRMLHTEAVMRGAWDDTAPRRSPDDVAAAVFASADAVVAVLSPPERALDTRRPAPRRYIGREVRLAIGVIAAAAAVVLAVGLRESRGRAPLAAAPEAAASAAPDVEVPEGRNAVVFATNDPSITVVWIY